MKRNTISVVLANKVLNEAQIFVYWWEQWQKFVSVLESENRQINSRSVFQGTVFNSIIFPTLPGTRSTWGAKIIHAVSITQLLRDSCRPSIGNVVDQTDL